MAAPRIYPKFFSEPFRYVRWAAHEKPAIFWSCIIGSMGPVIVVVAPSIRRFFNDPVGRPPIPFTYPIPKGPRVIPEGYDD